MSTDLLAIIIISAAWLVAALAGLGVGNLGRLAKDSRDLGERESGEERRWRSLLSR